VACACIRRGGRTRPHPAAAGWPDWRGCSADRVPPEARADPPEPPDPPPRTANGVELAHACSAACSTVSPTAGVTPESAPVTAAW